VSDLLSQAHDTPVASSMEALLQGLVSKCSTSEGTGSIARSIATMTLYTQDKFKDIELEVSGCNSVHERCATIV
jgi:hypothetical protein